MNFLGEQAISRATRVSGRTLWSLSAVGFLISVGWIETEQFSVAGLTFASGRLNQGIAALILFFILAHGVQWYGDLRSFQGWNIAGRKIVGLQYINDTEAKSKMEAFGQNLKRILEFEGQTNPVDHKKKVHAEQARDALPAVASQLPEFLKSVRDFGKFAFFYVYVWHLVLPIVVGVVAIAKLNHA